MSHLVIDSSRDSFLNSFKSIFKYRDLLFLLAYRDLKIRYSQTFFGFTWVFLQSFVTVLIFTLIFSYAIKIEVGRVPYPLFALIGVSCWTYFSFVVGQSSVSIIGVREMVKKVYFPKLIIPLSKSISGLVDFSAILFLTGVLMFFYKVTPSFNLFYTPLFIFLAAIIALGPGIWTCALSIRFRDFQHVVPFIVQVGLYISPVAYSSAIIPEKIKLFFYLNPMVGIIEGMRWSLIGGEFNMYAFISLGVGILIFISGVTYFLKVEDKIADII